MFTSKQYLAKAVEYGDLAKIFKSLNRESFTNLSKDSRCSQCSPITSNCSPMSQNRSAVDVRVFMQDDVQQ
jgi:hypothetical protein